MPWPLISRTDELSIVGNLLVIAHPGPLVLAGEPGAGRTTLLRRFLEMTADDRHQVQVVDTGGSDTLVPVAGAAVEVVPATVEAVRAASASLGSDGRRPFIVVDDVHLAGHDLIHLLRDLHRRRGVTLVLSASTAATVRPDPLDCLRYEAGARFVSLEPLTGDDVRSVLEGLTGRAMDDPVVTAMHAATGGNPRLLYDLAVTCGVAAQLVDDGSGVLGWPAEVSFRAPLPREIQHRIVRALDGAWADLSLGPAGDLCRLALAAGAGAQIRPGQVMALLLLGDPHEGLRLLDTIEQAGPARGQPEQAGPADGQHRHRLLLTRAILTAFGLRQVERAAALLTGAGAAAPDPRLLAARQWILAATGRAVATERVVPAPADLETSAFAHTAAAHLDLNAGRPQDAIGHLRRAIIAVRPLRDELPWMRPYLTGTLIDALLLAGRNTEATATAADFHAGRDGSGWTVAVSLSNLIASATADSGTTLRRTVRLSDHDGAVSAVTAG